jgi:hypothetical protein
MEKRVLVGVVFILLLWIPPLTQAQGDPNGFNGIPWGSDLGQTTGFISLKEFRDYRVCLRDGEVYRIEGAEVEEIRYEFYKNKFYSVTVRFSGNQNFRLLLEGLLRRFGAAEGRTKYWEEYEWSTRDLSVLLRYADAEKRGSLEYQYKPIFDQMTRDENCCTP